MKKTLLLALVLSSPAAAAPAWADENDAMRQCLAFQIATGRYAASDPQAPYQLLEACATQWQVARQRAMREKNISAETADWYMIVTLRDLLEKNGR